MLRSLSTGLLLAVAVGCSSALAANDDGFTFGDDADLTAGAVAPVTLGASAAWYNPAGLAGIDRISLSGSASAFVLRIRQIDELIRTELVDQQLKSDVSSIELVSVPTALVIGRRFGPHFGAAIGVFVPESEQFAFRAEKSVVADLGFGDAPFDQEYSMAIARQRYHVGAVFGGAVSPCFRVGGGVFLIYATESYEGVILGAGEPTFDANGDPVSPVAFGFSADSTRISTLAGQLTAGLQWDITPRFAASLVLRSPAVVFHRFGDQRSINGLAGAVPAIAQTGDFFGRTAEPPDAAAGTLMLPFEASLGLAYKWDSGWVAVDGDIEAPVRNDALFIDRGVSGNVRLGVFQRLDETWALGGGFFTDLASLQEPDGPGEFQLDYVGGTFGVALDTPLGLVDEERPKGLLMSTTLALRYAVGWGTAGGATFHPLTEDASQFVTVHQSPVIFHDIAFQIGSKLTY